MLSGIIHVLRTGCRWQDCPAVYGPPTTVYNRFHRWARRGLWQRLLSIGEQYQQARVWCEGEQCRGCEFLYEFRLYESALAMRALLG